jgi:WD40 repeat protein
MSLSENGQRLAVGSDDGYVEVWEVRGFEMTSRTLSHVGRVISVALSNDGTRIASLGRDGAIVVSDIASDPSYGIRPGALRSLASQVFKEEIKTARGVYFLSTGDLLVSTGSGQLGEIQLSATPRVAEPSPIRVKPQEIAKRKGSDY